MSAQLLAPPPAATELLLTSSNPELRRLAVDESDDEIELTGSVTSFYLKQLAQESIRPAIIGRKLRNRVVVGRPDAG